MVVSANFRSWRGCRGAPRAACTPVRGWKPHFTLSRVFDNRQFERLSASCWRPVSRTNQIKEFLIFSEWSFFSNFPEVTSSDFFRHASKQCVEEEAADDK